MGDPALSIVYKCTIDGFIPLGHLDQDRGPRLRVPGDRVPRGRRQRLHPQDRRPVQVHERCASRRPVDSNSKWLSMWLQSVMIKVIPQTMAITALNAAGEEITTWNLAGRRPGEVDRADPRHHGQRDRDGDPRGRLRADHRPRRARRRGRPARSPSPARSGSEGATMVMDAVGSAASAVGEALGAHQARQGEARHASARTSPTGETEIECMFNPTEYRLTQTVSVNRNRTPQRPRGGTPEYSGTNAMTLDDPALLRRLRLGQGRRHAEDHDAPQLDEADRAARATRTRPARRYVRFKWGGNTQLDDFYGFLKNVDGQVHDLPQGRHTGPGEGRHHDRGPAGADRAARTRRRTRRTAGGPTRSSRATRSSRSPTTSSAGRPTGGRSRSSTGSTTRSGCRPGTVLLIPSVADAARNA